MSWREQVYIPLLERNMENLQVQHLVRYFDYGKESKIAQALVRHFNCYADELDEDLFGIKCHWSATLTPLVKGLTPPL